MATTVLTHITHWRDYLELCKPKVVALIVFTAMVGMFLATPGWVPLNALIAGTLGIGLAAASAAAGCSRSNAWAATVPSVETAPEATEGSVASASMRICG